MEEQNKEQKNKKQNKGIIKKGISHALQALFEIYDKKYKLLLTIPFLMLFLALTQIGYQIYNTGDFIKKDVSLKGGVTVTVPFDKDFNIDNNVNIK